MSLFNVRWAEGWCCCLDALTMKAGASLCSLPLHHPLSFPGAAEKTAGRRWRRPPAAYETDLGEKNCKERRFNNVQQLDANAGWCRTHSLFPFLWQTSIVSITIFPRALRETFYKGVDFFFLMNINNINSKCRNNSKSEKQWAKTHKKETYNFRPQHIILSGLQLAGYMNLKKQNSVTLCCT